MSVWKGKGLSNREEKYGDSATHRFVIVGIVVLCVGRTELGPLSSESTLCF
jgi:hypothetical protein